MHVLLMNVLVIHSLINSYMHQQHTELIVYFTLLFFYNIWNLSFKCSEFQAFSGHCLKCTVTGVYHSVSGHGKSGDISIAVKLIRKGLQSKNI